MQWPQEPYQEQMHSPLLDLTMIALVCLGIYLELHCQYAISVHVAIHAKLL